jgi:hypothetical protein
MTDDRRRAGEGQIGDDAEGLLRQADDPRVGLEDAGVRKAGAQASREGGIELDRDHAAAAREEERRQRTGARADVEDELTGPGRRDTDELSCDVRPQEMPAACPCARAHGPSPSGSP